MAQSDVCKKVVALVKKLDGEGRLYRLQAALDLLEKPFQKAIVEVKEMKVQGGEETTLEREFPSEEEAHAWLHRKAEALQKKGHRIYGQIDEKFYVYKLPNGVYRRTYRVVVK